MCIGISNEAVDCMLELLKGTEDTTLEASLGQEREQTLDCIEPGGRGRGEVENKSGMACEPFHDVRVLMRCVVVDDQVDGEFLGYSGIDRVQESNELLMAMAPHALADDLAFEHVEGGEQGRGAMPFVVMRSGLAASRLQGQGWLGSIQGLNLALLV